MQVRERHYIKAYNGTQHLTEVFANTTKIVREK